MPSSSTTPKPHPTAGTSASSSKVEADLAHDRTRIEWARGLGSINPFKNPAATARVFALRKRAAAFGHNAPMWASMPAVFKDEYPGGVPSIGGGVFGTLAATVSTSVSLSKYSSDWPAFNASARAPGTSVAWLDLDGVVADIAAGSLVVVGKGDFNHPAGGSGDTYVELYQVRATSEVSRAQFALSGKVTPARTGRRELRRRVPCASARAVGVRGVRGAGAGRVPGEHGAVGRHAAAGGRAPTG